jgi:ribosome maturation protein SDO1
LSSSKFTTVRLTLEGERFEILVNPDPALNFKLGRNVELSQVLAVEEIFSDAGKGLRVPSEKLQKHFKTSDILQVSETILRRGDLQLTTDQRRKLLDDKKRQIVSIISKNYVDPRTGLPHPPIRIEQAMQEARISVDPFKEAGEQARAVVENLRAILPLKSERLKILVKVPPQFAPQSMGVLKNYGELQREEWGADGSLSAIIEIPAGIHATMLDRLGSVTKGSAQASVLK